MGAYVYKVTGKVERDSEGRKANVLKYAYKPYWGWDDSGANERMRASSGCGRSESYVRRSKNFTGRVMFEACESGAARHSIEWDRGTITDDHFHWILDRESRATA
jgi:hypothetical protein